MSGIAPSLLALAGHGLPGAPAPPADGWAERFDEVTRHGLAGFLARAVEDGLVELDDHTATRLSARLEAEAIRAVALEGELVRLDAVLDTLPMVVLKGPVLAHGAYDDPAVRPFTDLDVLVPDHAVHDAIESLAALGYERARPEPAPGYDAHIGKAVLLTHPRGVSIDLHRTLAAGRPGRGVDVDEILATSIRVPVGRLAVRAPSWAAHLAEVCLHAVVGDDLARALSVRDVAEVGRHDQLDPDAFVDLVARWGLAEVAALALSTAARAFALDLPGPLAGLAGCADGREPAASSGRARSAAARLDDLRTAEPARRLALARALVLPSGEYLRWRYGTGSAPRLYARRWRDLARRARTTRRSSRRGRPAG